MGRMGGGGGATTSFTSLMGRWGMETGNPCIIYTPFISLPPLINNASRCPITSSLHSWDNI